MQTTDVRSRNKNNGQHICSCFSNDNVMVSCVRLLTRASYTIIFQQIISTISFELWSHTHKMAFYPCRRLGMQCLLASYFRQSDIIETNKKRHHVHSLTPPPIRRRFEAFIFRNFDLISMATASKKKYLIHFASELAEGKIRIASHDTAVMVT